METKGCRTAARVQDNDKGGIQSGSDCLGTPVILRIIMENLSNTELVRISVVNKLWNYEARSVLKNRGNLNARLQSRSPCQKVAAFASDVRQMKNVVPFSGISISLEDWHSCCDECGALSTGSLELDPNYNIILERVPWKRLRFHWGQNWEGARKCQAFLLAQKILQDFSGDLEEFKLSLGGRSEKFMQQILQDCKFPLLKTLDFRAGTKAPGEDCTGLTKALVARAPKLQEFHEEWWVKLTENVMEGSSAILIPHGPVWPAYDELSEAILPALRLASVTLEVKEEDFSLERFNRITPYLLDNSKSTLKRLSMDTVFALPLMCYGISFKNVKVLNFHMDYRHMEHSHPRVLNFLNAFDFTRIFPNLDLVSIQTVAHNMSMEKINEFIAQGNAFLREPQPDRAATIKQLHLSEHIGDSAIPFLGQMFPNTKILQMYKKDGQDIPYGLIWDHFKGLEELVTHKSGHSYQNMLPKNLDSVFCGIFPEEVAELRKQDYEYLESVKIVPVMPAITCLTELKFIDMVIWDADYCPGFSDEPWGLGLPSPRECDPTFLFSKVTGLIAFTRMPSLFVSMRSNCPELERAIKSHEAVCTSQPGRLILKLMGSSF